MQIVRRERLETDIAVVECSHGTTSLSVRDLCFDLRSRSDDRYRWLLFVYGPAARRNEVFVSRAGLASVLTACLEEGAATLDLAAHLPPRDETFLVGLKEPAKRDVPVGGWWTDPPNKAHSFDVYMRAGAEFMADLTSDRPLGSVGLRGGLWIILRGLAANGKRCEINDILYRFHCALLYDLRHGAHRFSSVLGRAFERLPNAHVLSSAASATASAAIAVIDADRPIVTRALQTMFPTDTRFGALPIECLGLVSRLMSSKSLLIQAGWIMAPLRLLRPHVLAARTVATLRRVCADWLRQHAVAKAGGASLAPAEVVAAERGVKRLFCEPIVDEILPTALDAMYTSVRTSAPTAAGSVSPPPCVRRYMEWSESGHPGGKLPFEARWPVLRTLSQVGVARPDIERVYLSVKGMQNWYAASDREGELRHRKRDLHSMFGGGGGGGLKSKTTRDGKYTTCVDFAAFGLCPFAGDDSDRVRACCSARTNLTYSDRFEPRDTKGRPIHTPVQVAALRPRKSTREHVAVEIDVGAAAADDNDDGGFPVSRFAQVAPSTSVRMRFVTAPPARIAFSKLSKLQ